MKDFRNYAINAIELTFNSLNDQDRNEALKTYYLTQECNIGSYFANQVYKGRLYDHHDGSEAANDTEHEYDSWVITKELEDQLKDVICNVANDYTTLLPIATTLEQCIDIIDTFGDENLKLLIGITEDDERMFFELVDGEPIITTDTTPTISDDEGGLVFDTDNELEKLIETYLDYGGVSVEEYLKINDISFTMLECSFFETPIKYYFL